MTNRYRLVLLAALAVAGLPACSASSNAPSTPELSKVAVLLRTYFIPLRPEIKLGPKHPALDRFQFNGYLPGGQDGKAQLRSLSARYTLKDLAYQYSDSRRMEEGKEAVLQMGFGEPIQVKVGDLAKAGGALIADFNITVGQRELVHRKIPFKPGDCLLFAGRLDTRLPILSVFSVEIRRFPENQVAAFQDFMLQPRRDSEAFAPPQPAQRNQEPYLPGVGDVTMPELTSKQTAAYPDVARAQKLEGDVIVEVVVDREGKVTNPRVITPASIFDASALEAAATYRYKPATKNGQPVAVTMNIIIVYKLTLKSAELRRRPTVVKGRS
ncbi:MAG: hypothetical protein DMH00_11365 [Acidobacteria bacterium]|nr:MAG: hypothetical protein DMH00_11365 [Acidobacteriota bacterium]